jgi:hypothetical protein
VHVYVYDDGFTAREWLVPRPLGQEECKRCPWEFCSWKLRPKFLSGFMAAGRHSRAANSRAGPELPCRCVSFGAWARRSGQGTDRITETRSLLSAVPLAAPVPGRRRRRGPIGKSLLLCVVCGGRNAPKSLTVVA